MPKIQDTSGKLVNNPQYGLMADRILESFARGNKDGNFWDEVQDDRAPSGTFEQAIDFDPTDEISQEQIEPDIIDMQDERDEVRELLSELPTTLEDDSTDPIDDTEINEESISKLI